MGRSGRPPQRVLLVPDVPYWICATIARAYVRHNPEVDFEICSGRVLRTLPRLIDYIDNFDLVHFLTPQDANKSIADFSGRIATVTTIHHVQDEGSTQSVGASDGVMTASSQWMTRLEGAGVPASKLVQVPYGVDTALFRPPTPEERRTQRETLGMAADAFVVGFVGKKSSDAGGRKGTDVFVCGIAQLAKECSSLHVLLVGPGWDGVVAALTAQQIRCTYRPFVVEEAAFARLYHAMDVYWCSSNIEGGPIPVLEAMASGVCCLATAVGMVPDVMESGIHGLILSFNDAEAFAAETGKLAADSTRRMALGAAAAKHMAQQFDWAHSAPRVLPLYQRATENFSEREIRSSSTSRPLPWPREWVAAEEEALAQRFYRDAAHPPSGLRRALRTLLESRWLRALTRPSVPNERDRS